MGFCSMNQTSLKAKDYIALKGTFAIWNPKFKRDFEILRQNLNCGKNMIKIEIHLAFPSGFGVKIKPLV